jgi:hypothetical protein
MMEATPTKGPETPAVPAQGRTKRGRRSRQSGEEVIRFFLAKEGTSAAKPELGEEIQNEAEALIKAFQSKTGVLYVLHAYKADAEIQGGSPTLVKRPLQKQG